MAKKAFYFGLLLLVLVVDFHQIHAADSGTCSKPKVAVKLVDFYERTYEVLQRQYPFQTKEYWLSHIQQKMVEKLRANSPGIEIFPMASGKEYDYYIEYNVSVIGCGEQEKIGNLLSSKDTCYWVHGTLYSNDACGLAGVGFRSANIQYKDIDTAVTLFALKMGNIETIAAAHESERPIPPRGPQIRIDKEPQAVSPLEGERETMVDARVTNCRGEPVYDKAGKRFHVIAGAKQGKRGETHPVKENASAVARNMWLISPNAQGGASLKYKLTKGIKAETETLTFTACGLGTKAEKKQTIEIEGLEIRVKPQKTQIKPFEDTRIDIEFVKVSVKGERKPIPGKELSLKIEGLKDGVVSPKEKVSTNAKGRATLVYQSGQNDKTVKITAFYQPQNFPDRAEGSAGITIQEGKGDLEIQINGSLNWTGQEKDGSITINSNFTISGTMTMDKQKHGGDYENYEIENLQLTYSHDYKSYRKNCQTTGVEASGSAQVQKGRIIIRYPRIKSGRARQGELDFRFNSEPLPAKVTSCYESCKKCETKNVNIVVSTEVVDQKSPIIKNQQEFLGSRSFGITDMRGAMTFMLMGSPAWSFNDNESKDITTFPFVPKELEKVITEKGGSITQMRNLGIGINKQGNDGRLTWKIRKIRNRN